MTDEERERYFGVLVEQRLYEYLQLLSESTKKDKKKLAAQAIKQFYEENKEQFQLKDPDDVIKN